MACATAPADTAGDRALLLALHEQAMEAHRKGDVELLLQADAEDFVLASRGEISRPSPIQFESAWIELYEKRGGSWRRVGNVSNFK